MVVFLYGLPYYELAKLQRVQNTAARLIVGARRFDHMTPIVKDLHWWSILARLEFKILLLTYKCPHNQGPSYLCEPLEFRNPPRNRTHTTLIPSTMVRGRFPSLLLNWGTLYLNILSQPRHCQLLKRHLKLTFFVAISLTTNNTFVV